MADVKTAIEPLEEPPTKISKILTLPPNPPFWTTANRWLKPHRGRARSLLRGVVLVPNATCSSGGKTVRRNSAGKPRNNEAQAHCNPDDAVCRLGPPARYRAGLIRAVEDRARDLGYLRLNFDVRATQADAVDIRSLASSTGTNPATRWSTAI